MAKQTKWTRHSPDGVVVPLDRPDLGRARHGRTTHSGSDAVPWRAWTRDMRGQTGLGLLAEVERAACAIVGSEGARVPRAPRRTGPALTALLAATAEPPHTCRYFAARALGAAIRAREYLEAGDAENAVYCSLRAMWNLWAANLRRSLEPDALRGRKTKRSASLGGKERQRQARSDDASEKDRADRAQREAQDEVFLPLRARGMRASAAARIAAQQAGGSWEAIVRRHRRQKKAT